MLKTDSRTSLRCQTSERHRDCCHFFALELEVGGVGYIITSLARPHMYVMQHYCSALFDFIHYPHIHHACASTHTSCYAAVVSSRHTSCYAAAGSLALPHVTSCYAAVGSLDDGNVDDDEDEDEVHNDDGENDKDDVDDDGDVDIAYENYSFVFEPFFNAPIKKCLKSDDSRELSSCPAPCPSLFWLSCLATYSWER